MAGPGIGKTTLTEAITERLAAEMIVVQIHGSSSLSRVPFGILAPYTAELTAEDSVSPGGRPEVRLELLREAQSGQRHASAAHDG